MELTVKFVVLRRRANVLPAGLLRQMGSAYGADDVKLMIVLLIKDIHTVVNVQASLVKGY